MIRLGVVTPLILFVFSAFGQASHYSTQGFGAQSTFVSGAMIATVNDNSAIFYNPAGIGNLAASEISINANVYGISYNNLYNGLGSDNNLESVRALLYPQLLSGSIKLKSEKWNLVAAYLSRHYAKQRIPLFDTQVADFTNQFPGEEAYNVNLDIENFLHEQWGGIGVGYKHSENLSLGASAFIAYRNQKAQLLYSRSLVAVDALAIEPSSINLSQRTVIDIVSLQLKAGVQYKTGKWNLGANLTVPKIKLFAFGNGRFEEVISNVEGLTLLRQDGVALEQSSNYHTKHKTPWSMALAASVTHKKNTWHVAVEGFTGIANYEMAKPKSPFTFISPLSKQIRYQELLAKGSLLIAETSARPVVNFAIGCDRELTTNTTLHYGFRTDYNYYNGDQDNIVQFDRDYYDLYHLTLGISTSKDLVTGTIGIDNSLGYRQNIPRLGNSNTPDFNDLNPGADGTATAFTYIGILVVGVTKFF